MYMYIHIYTYLYIDLYLCALTFPYIYIYMYIYIHKYKYMYVCIPIYLYIPLCTSLTMHIYSTVDISVSLSLSISASVALCFLGLPIYTLFSSTHALIASGFLLLLAPWSLVASGSLHQGSVPLTVTAFTKDNSRHVGALLGPAMSILYDCHCQRRLTLYPRFWTLRVARRSE